MSYPVSLILVRTSDSDYCGNTRNNTHENHKKGRETKSRQSDNYSNIHIVSFNSFYYTLLFTGLHIFRRRRLLP